MYDNYSITDHVAEAEASLVNPTPMDLAAGQIHATLALAKVLDTKGGQIANLMEMFYDGPVAVEVRG